MSEIQRLEYVNEKHAESRLHSELKQAEQILGKFRDKFGEDSQEYKNISKEYKEAYDTFTKGKESDLKISKDEWILILNELKDIEKLSLKYLKSDEYKVEELQISKFEFMRVNKKTQKLDTGNKQEIDIFLNSSLSIASLSDSQIGKLLSGIYDLGKDYIDKFVTRFIQDEKGLDHLIKRWQPGKKSIDKMLHGKEESMGQKIKNTIIDKIIESLNSKIRADLEQSLKKKYPNISKEELDKKVNNVIERIRKVQEPELVFQILGQELGDVDTSIRVTKDEARKKQMHNIKKGNEDKTSKNEFDRNTKVIQSMNNLSNIRQKQKPEEREKLDTALINSASSKQPMTTSMIIAKTVSDLEARGDCKDLVSSLKSNFNDEIKIGNQEIKQQEKLQVDQSQKQENTFSYADGTKINYSQETSGGYLIETSNGGIVVGYEELQIVKNSKDALKNMIKFRETLEELNLGGLFKYRESIFKAISNKNTIAFNVNDDYLNKNELTIFVQSVLHSVGYELKNITNFEALKSEVRSVNKVGIVGGVKDINVYGDSYIEQKFIEKFDPKRISIFNQNAFEESLGNLFGNKTV